MRLFQRTRQVRVHWHSHLPCKQVAEEVVSRQQVLAIVNTKGQVRELYQCVKELCGQHVYHLSTDMCSAHRFAVITAVSQLLQLDVQRGLQACRLISTQCVEAGVDLDFPVVWRSLAPLEAISQAAGRCNREGRLSFGEVNVFRPPSEDEKYPDPSYQKAAVEVQMMLMEKSLDIGDPEIIKEYYQRYFDNNFAALRGCGLKQFRAYVLPFNPPVHPVQYRTSHCRSGPGL